MYELKRNSEDFIVEEIPNRNWLPSGPYLIARLEKRLCATEEIVGIIAQQLRIKRSRIAYAGLKDKHAVATQYISIKQVLPTDLNKFFHKHCTLSFTGYSDEPLSLGSLKGNHFEIVIRNLADDAVFSFSTIFPNYFGQQRFAKHNDLIGKAMVRGSFDEVCSLIVSSGGLYGRMVAEALARNEKDFVGALNQIPKKILSLFIHAYQAKMFNRMLKDVLEVKSPADLTQVSFPLIGFGTTSSLTCYKQILREEHISPRDFIIRALPDLSSEGLERNAVAVAQDLVVGVLEADECNVGRKKTRVSFSLPKGSYATVFVAHLTGNLENILVS